jgi:sugar O-acyltransferase (sialic acid O-acetyltransferase NeuD family)
MSRQRIVIIGAAGHAKVVAGIIRMNQSWDIVGFIDEVNPERHSALFCGARILGGYEQLPQLLNQGVNNVFLGFGNCIARQRRMLEVLEMGFNLPFFIHPNAIIDQDVEIGDGTVIMAGAVISPGTRIGRCVIINTSSSIDHDCDIHDCAHVAPGARLAGNVQVGATSWIGIGASVIENIRIGRGVLVGAGAAVVRDIADDRQAIGVPARVTKNFSV